MGALFSAPGQAWPWIGVAAAGLLLGRLSAPSDRPLTVWLALSCLPLGTVGFALLLVPAFTLLPPRAASPVASLAALACCTASFAHFGSGLRRPPKTSIVTVAWIVVIGLVASWVALAATRLAHAAAVGIAIPPILGEPASGDVALTSLRMALIARDGIPPPSPLDPDYPLQYRYLFHVLAAAFASQGDLDYARVTAATLGLVLAAIMLAGAAFASLRVRSGVVWVGAGCLAALYGPSYLVQGAGAALAERVVSWSAVERYVAGRWALSPLTPSFPSTFSSVESAPAIPAGVLCWLVVLLVVGAAWPGRVDTPTTPRVTFARGGLAGAALGALAFAADYFLPFALVSLGLAALVVPRADQKPRHLRHIGAGAAAGFVACLAIVLVCTRQVAPAGAATGVSVRWNDAMAITATYGGNRALLAGGTPLPMPNWVHVHDWGILFGPALLAALAVTRRRDALLLAALLAPLLTALFWHAFTVVYEAGLPTDLRVQMYRFASMATGVAAAPTLVALAARADRALQRHRVARGFVHAALTLPALVVGAGAGLLLAAGSASLPRDAPPESLAEAALARRLAAEPVGARLALLGGPSTFIGMYYGSPSGNMPIWWAIGGAPVPVGWDFGHPERYQAPYRLVVEAFDPGAAAELGLTHVVLASDALSAEQRERASRFLARCGAVELASTPLGVRQRRQALYRIEPAACRASG